MSYQQPPPGPTDSRRPSTFTPSSSGAPPPGFAQPQMMPQQPQWSQQPGQKAPPGSGGPYGAPLPQQQGGPPQPMGGGPPAPGMFVPRAPAPGVQPPMGGPPGAFMPQQAAPGSAVRTSGPPPQGGMSGPPPPGMGQQPGMGPPPPARAPFFSATAQPQFAQQPPQPPQPPQSWQPQPPQPQLAEQQPPSEIRCDVKRTIGNLEMQCVTMFKSELGATHRTQHCADARDPKKGTYHKFVATSAIDYFAKIKAGSDILYCVGSTAGQRKCNRALNVGSGPCCVGRKKCVRAECCTCTGDVYGRCTCS